MKLVIIYIMSCITLLVMCFSCGNAKSKGENPILKVEQLDLIAPEIESYVSLTCEKGDITLVLDDDSTFYMDIKYWDNKLKKHTGSANIIGRWLKTGPNLTLTVKNNIILYELTNTQMEINDNKIHCKTYSFKSSEKEFFGTGYDLLDQKQADAFLASSIK